MNLNINSWKWFQIQDIFQIVRGKRLKSEDRESGDIFYYAASDSNNGLTDKISNPLFVDENKIIYTVFGDAYFAPGKFTASDVVNILSNKNVNEKNSIFIITVLNKLKYKYSYGRQAYINKFEKEWIKLPVTKDGKPDWEFMEKYIEYLRERERESASHSLKIIEENAFLSYSNKKYELNINKWKEFELKKLFKIEKSKNYTQENIENNLKGKIPYVTRTENNNGVKAFINNVDDVFVLENGNCITIGGESALAFYQPFDFISGNNISKLYLKGEILTKNIALFICVLLNKERYRYSYGRAFNIKNIKKTKLLIPVTKDGKPDWEFMEKYIKSLPYSKFL